MEKQILKIELSKTLDNLCKTDLKNILNNAKKSLTKRQVKSYDNKE